MIFYTPNAMYGQGNNNNNNNCSPGMPVQQNSENSNTFRRPTGSPNGAPRFGQPGGGSPSYPQQSSVPVYVNHPYGVESGRQNYNNTPTMGSLGTPQVFGNMWRNSASVGRMGSLKDRSYRKGSHNASSGGYGGGDDNSVDPNTPLIPTRPLLKALAKYCRPQPPWCVGNLNANLLLADEIGLFASFNSSTDEELAMNEACLNTVKDMLQSLWPEVELRPMGITAAGNFFRKDTTSHYYAENSSDITDEVRKQLEAAANERGAQIEFAADNRGLQCFVLTDSLSGLRCCVRVDPRAAARCGPASEIIQATFGSDMSARGVLFVLFALLQQNRILDDSGINPRLLPGEAAAVMLLSVLNSYDSADVPDAGRLLMDFFLTFGFISYFNPVSTSVVYTGMQPTTPKKHANAQLSVIDPADDESNLTPSLDRVSNLQAVFSYCYSALNQYAQVSGDQRRAQSALSSIIGGEPYWGRVFRFYEQKVEPYCSVVESKRNSLVKSLYSS